VQGPGYFYHSETYLVRLWNHGHLVRGGLSASRPGSDPGARRFDSCSRSRCVEGCRHPSWALNPDHAGSTPAYAAKVL